MSISRSSFIIVCALGPGALQAQSQHTADAHVIHATTTLRLDGMPDEPVWLTADSIADFTQKEPAEGRPATERTLVRHLKAGRRSWRHDARRSRSRSPFDTSPTA